MFHTLQRPLIAGVLAISLVSASPAWAQHRSGHHDHGGGDSWGLGLGLLLGSVLILSATQPAYDPPAPVYAGPPVVYTEAPTGVPYANDPPPPVQPLQATQSWWYYCASPEGYYPYVKNCRQAWTRIPSVPPGE